MQGVSVSLSKTFSIGIWHCSNRIVSFIVHFIHISPVWYSPFRYGSLRNYKGILHIYVRPSVRFILPHRTGFEILGFNIVLKEFIILKTDARKIFVLVKVKMAERRLF